MRGGRFSSSGRAAWLTETLTLPVFNIVAPTTTQDTPSKDLAAKYYPNAEIRDGLEDNKGFWTTSKAKKLLGWVHEDKE